MERQGQKTRLGFHEGPVRGMSIAMMILGCFCFGIGVSTLIYALLLKCKYRHENYSNPRPWHHNYYYSNYGDITTTTTTTAATTVGYDYENCQYFRTYGSAGIWSGLMFVANGIIGILAAKKKTTCFIVSLMVLSVVSAWIALGGATLAIFSNFDDRYQVDSYPVDLIVPNCVVALFCVVAFILSWIKFGYACRAICCNGQTGYPAIKQQHGYQYQSLHANPMMYSSQPMNAQDGATPSAAAPMFQPLPQPGAPEPIYLVQGHQVIGILPQNAQHPLMGNSNTTIAAPPSLVPAPNQQQV